MSTIALIVSGLIIGIIAKLLMPGRDVGGFIMTILLGIAGMFLGSMIGRAAGIYEPDQTAGWIVSILGALALLAAYHLLFVRRSNAYFLKRTRMTLLLDRVSRTGQPHPTSC